MKILVLFFLSYLALQNVSAQAFLEVDTTRYIEWNIQRPLTWSDFQYHKQRPGKDKGRALTTVFHSVRGEVKNGKPNFEVRVLYVKDKSWTTSTESLALLNHEKLHFDLAELYGRKIRKQIEFLGQKGGVELKVYKKYIKRILDDFKLKSMAYDKETQHGSASRAQEEWYEFVQLELIRMKKYKYEHINKL